MGKEMEHRSPRLNHNVTGVKTMKDYNEHKKWSMLIKELNETNVHLDLVVYSVLSDLKHHHILNECHLSDVNRAIVHLEDAQHFCESSREREIILRVMSALNQCIISRNMALAGVSDEFCDEQENRIDEIRAINPELADSINDFINTLASKQDVIHIYTPSLSNLLMHNMELIKETVDAAWHKSINKRKETILLAKTNRTLNRRDNI